MKLCALGEAKQWEWVMFVSLQGLGIKNQTEAQLSVYNISYIIHCGKKKQQMSKICFRQDITVVWFRIGYVIRHDSLQHSAEDQNSQ